MGWIRFAWRGTKKLPPRCSGLEQRVDIQEAWILLNCEKAVKWLVTLLDSPWSRPLGT